VGFAFRRWTFKVPTSSGPIQRDVDKCPATLAAGLVKGVAKTLDYRRVADAHGEYCNCDFLPIAKVIEDHATVEACAAILSVRHPRVALLLDAHDKGRLRSVPSTQRKIAISALTGLISQACPSRVVPDEPDIGWRQVSRPGYCTPSERWPDELDPNEWSLWFKGELKADANPVQVASALAGLGSTTLASLVDDHREDVPPPMSTGRSHNDDWSHEEILRVLQLARSRHGGWHAPDSPAVTTLATRFGREPYEVLAFSQHLYKCDIGIAQPTPAARYVLSDFPADASDRLERRLAMLDSFESFDEDEIDDPATLLDVATQPLDLEPVHSAVAEDGGPDPLALVRELLPGGRGTRGRPPIVYTPTKLETGLLPWLLSTDPTLVVLSGNAGDGKTAFLESVLENSGVDIVPGQNEYYGPIGRNEYVVVLDGSEDSAKRTNDALLSDALGEFRGDDPVAPARGTLIAINKGRLLKFLNGHRRDFGYLWKAVASRYLGDEAPPDNNYLLIDLNERSGLSPSPEESIYGGITQKLANWSGWDDQCGSCSAVNECPVRFNARLLKGKTVRSQLWKLLVSVDLDDRVHVTTRHLVTKVASAVVGSGRCAEIRERVGDGSSFPPETYLYSSLFEGAGSNTADAAVMDRVLESYDPSEAGSPKKDRQLAYLVLRGATPSIFTVEAGPDMAELERESADLSSRSVDDEPRNGEPEYRLRALRLVRHVSRRLFLLEPDNKLAPQPPVRTQETFLATSAGGTTPQLLQDILRSLNGTLGIEASKFEDLLAPQDYSQGLRGNGFAVLVPKERFAITAGDSLGNRYTEPQHIESWPRSIRLEARDSDGTLVAWIAMPLLMFEIVDRAGQGFRPTSQTERNYMVRLDRFYRRLAEHHWRATPTHVLYENGRLRARASISASHLSFAEA
jgi:hypothetical protein